MKKFIILIIIVMLLFNGLANQREINKLAIVSCIGIDITEEGKFNVVVDVLDTKKGSTSGGSSQEETSQVTIYESTQNSVQEALRDIIKQSSKRLSLAHMKLVMLSEELVKQKDILDILDFFIRDYEGGNNFTLVISKDAKPKEIINKLSESSNDFAMDLKDSIEINNKNRGSCANDILNDNLRNILKEGGGLVINSIELLDNEEKQEESSGKESKENPQNAIIIDMAYFKDNKMAGYLDNDDNIIYNLLRNDLKNTLIEINKAEDRVSIELTDSSVKLKPEIKDGEYIVNISVDIISNITEVGKNISIDTKEDLDKIKQMASEKLKDQINTYVNNCKYKYDVDLVEFGALFYKYKYKEYEEVKEKFYDEIYDNIKLNIDVNINIKNHGGVKKSW